MYSFTFNTRMCRITVTADSGFIIRIILDDKGASAEAEPLAIPDATPQDKDICLQAATELNEYFDGTRREFTLPVKLSLPPFYMRILEELKNVPYGTVISYGELSQRAGSPKAFRACGCACHSNPVPIIIPCHRVTGTLGPGGYAYGLSLKEKLLELEGVKL